MKEELNDIKVKTYKINTIVYHADRFKPTIIVESKVKSVSIEINREGVPFVEYRLFERKDDDYARGGTFNHEELFLTAKEAMEDKIKKLNEKYENLVKDIEQKYNEMYNPTEVERVEYNEKERVWKMLPKK